jgi:putative phage-type endonuclease
MDRFGTSLVDVDASDREAWLAWRAGGIGASECAAALGASRWMTPYELYQIKVGALAEKKPTEAMIRGLDLEPVVLKAYTRRTGRRIVANQVCVQHPKYPFIRATIDAIDECDNIVEVKTAGWRQGQEWPEDGDETRVPEETIAQVQQQCLILECDAFVAALIAGEDFRTYQVKSNEIIRAALVERLAKFWKCVETRTPPEMTDRDDRVAAMLAPTTDEPMLLGAWEAELVALWEDNRRAAARFTEAGEAARDAVVRALNGSSRGILPDGREFTRRRVDRKAYTVEEGHYYRVDVKVPKGGR